MCYLRFDKTQMANLQDSLYKEMLITNRSGAYCCTTLVGCNIRKYHGLLVIPVPSLDDENHVLLSSLDETVIQHGAEFNLGLHKYQGENYSPKGHKYILSFEWDKVPTTIYRIGGVVLKKEIVFHTDIHRLYIRYTLREAHSPTTLRLKPFLAFRSVRQWTHENGVANKSYEEVENGIKMNLYAGYPDLYMQLNRPAKFVYAPDWYRGLDYPKERERGYDSSEDLLVPGYFEMPIKKGESILFSAGISPVPPRSLSRLWDDEISRRIHRVDMYSCLKNAAEQFYQRIDNKQYLLAGYPWFTSRARDEFISLPGCTFVIGKTEAFYRAMETATGEIKAFLNGERKGLNLKGIDEPDVLLWFIRTIQQYAQHTSIQEAAERYGALANEIIQFIRKGMHRNLFLHSNGLLYVNGKDKPATWMNAVEDGHPITPRTGYVVEINALWYNALKFCAELSGALGDTHASDLLNYQAETTKAAFVNMFWNGTYLYDFVDGNYSDREVRPNMIFAAGLPHSPLDRQQQKSVVDITTRELLTPKGLRTLSPKSGSYRPIYIGGQLERDRNYHNGPVWTWTIGAYAEAYLKIYKQSGISFIERFMGGLESEMTELCIGTLSELYDGNPPFKGHGGMSFAMNVSEVLRVLNMLKETENENK